MFGLLNDVLRPEPECSSNALADALTWVSLPFTKLVVEELGFLAFILTYSSLSGKRNGAFAESLKRSESTLLFRTFIIVGLTYLSDLRAQGPSRPKRVGHDMICRDCVYDHVSELDPMSEKLSNFSTDTLLRKDEFTDANGLTCITARRDNHDAVSQRFEFKVRLLSLCHTRSKVRALLVLGLPKPPDG
jgi:hypothetical protein